MCVQRSIRRHQERRALLTPILTDFSVRITAAPAIIFSKPVSPDNAQTEVSTATALGHTSYSLVYVVFGMFRSKQIYEMVIHSIV